MAEQFVDFTGVGQGASRTPTPAPTLDFTVPKVPEQQRTPLQAATQRSRDVGEKIRASVQNTTRVAADVRRANADTITLATEAGNQQRDIVNKTVRNAENITANPFFAVIRSLFGDEDFDRDVQIRKSNIAKEEFARIQRNTAAELSAQNAQKAAAAEELNILVAQGTREGTRRTAEREAAKFEETKAKRIEDAALAQAKFDVGRKDRRFDEIVTLSTKLEAINQNKVTNALALKNFNEKKRNNEFSNELAAANALEVINQNKIKNDQAESRLFNAQLNVARGVMTDAETQEQRKIDNQLKTNEEERAQQTAILQGKKFEESKRATSVVEFNALSRTLQSARRLLLDLNNGVDKRQQQIFDNIGKTLDDKLKREKAGREVAEGTRQVKRLEVFVDKSELAIEHSTLVNEELKRAAESNVQEEQATLAAIEGFDLALAASGTEQGDIEAALMEEAFPGIDVKRTDILTKVVQDQETRKLNLAKLRVTAKGTPGQQAAGLQEALAAFFSGPGAVGSGTVLDRIASQTKDGSVTVKLGDGTTQTIPSDVLRQEQLKRRTAMLTRQRQETADKVGRFQVIANLNRDAQNLEVTKGIVGSLGGSTTDGSFQNIKEQLDSVREFAQADDSTFPLATVQSLSSKSQIDDLRKVALESLPKPLRALVETGARNYLASSRTVTNKDGVKTIVAKSGNFGLTAEQASSVTSSLFKIPTAATFASRAINKFKENVNLVTKKAPPKAPGVGRDVIQTLINLSTKTEKSNLDAGIRETVSRPRFMKSLDTDLLAVEDSAGFAVLFRLLRPEFPEQVSQFIDSADNLRNRLFMTQDRDTKLRQFNGKSLVDKLVQLENPEFMARLAEIGQDPRTAQFIQETLNFTARQIGPAANYTLISGGRLPGANVINKVQNFRGFVARVGAQ